EQGAPASAPGAGSLMKAAPAFLTARELAAMALPSMPSTKRGMQDWLKAADIAGRKRKGRGGGREDAVAALPENVQAAIAAQHLPARVARPRMVQPVIALKPWQRSVLDSRATVLQAIEGIHLAAIAEGLPVTKAGAIDVFLADLAAGRLSPIMMEHVR